MTDLPHPQLDMLPPQDIKRSDSNVSNISDEIGSYLDDGSGAFDLSTLEAVVGDLARSKTVENAMAQDFMKSPVPPVLNPNEVATKKTPPNGRTVPPLLPVVGEESERPQRLVGRKMGRNPSPPITSILGTSLPKTAPLAHPPLDSRPAQLGENFMLGEGTKANIPVMPMRPPPLASRPSRPLAGMMDRSSPPIKTTSPPIGRLTPPMLNSSKKSHNEETLSFPRPPFGTEKRPSRRRLPDKQRKEMGPKEPTEDAKKFLQIVQDKLRDSTSGPSFRPVYSTVRPIVCHYTNTPFYAQCSTAKLGWCTWCQMLRPGNQKQGSICLNCGERLTAKYHRWYPQLVRLEPLERDRRPDTYRKYRPLFEHFNITWSDEKQFNYVVSNYMLMKIYLSTQQFEVDALHLERAYMIGVFAGREFQTGALARKLLREGCGLAMFRADFPEFFEVYLLREERAAVAESMNQSLFQGGRRAYFHAHHTNIEGWYDQNIVGREHIVQLFKDLCNNVLQKNANAAFKINGVSPMIPRSGTPVDRFSRPPNDIPNGPSPNKPMEGRSSLPPFLAAPGGPQAPVGHEPIGPVGIPPMGSPPMMGPPMMGPPPHLMNGPHGIIPHGPPNGPPQIFSPIGFGPNSPMNPIRHQIVPSYVPVAPPPGQGPPYAPLPMQRSLNSVSMTTPTPPPPMLGGSPFDRQYSGGSSVGGTFVPHNPLVYPGKSQRY